jgi:tetratricopeptide (TPR) repeat protein/predicted Ser/Thr protein kinase
MAATPEFGPRYRVLGIIGKGGMGEVFRAYDAELRCEVALKVVRADHEDDASIARFRREIALARRVSSPNVLRVYDLAEHEGLRFLSMEYVDGEDLAAMMRRDGRLPVARALKLFRQVCSGLEAAHAEGVIHRDLKPQNVLVDKDDRVRVADFGLARSVGDSGLTASGMQLGSPAYMSPEQVKGEPVDERSDVYSLGIMLYQLLAGETPFQGESAHAVMEMRLHRAPRPLREVVPDVPRHVEAVVARCLEVKAGDRYRAVRELVGDLASEAPPVRRSRRALWIAAGGAAACAAAIVAVVALRGSPRDGNSAPSPSAPTVKPARATSGQIQALVLASENRSGDPALDSLGMIVLSALRRSRNVDPMFGPDLETLASELADQPLPINDELGRALAEHSGHRVIVVRSVAVAKGAGFTITVSAIDATTRAPIYERSLDAMTVDRVVPTTGRVVAGLRAALGDRVPEREIEQTGLSPSLEAVQEFALGTQLNMAGDEAGAIAHFREAISRDPDFSFAHARLGVLYSNVNRYVEAKAELSRGLALQDRLDERDLMMVQANYFNVATGEIDRAIAGFREVLDVWPDDRVAQSNLGLAYQRRRDFKKAIEVEAKIVRQHPRDRITRGNLADAELEAGELDKSANDLYALLRDLPRPNYYTYENLGVVETLRGRLPEARDAYTKLAALQAWAGAAFQADQAAAEGRLGDAVELLQRGISIEGSAHHDETLEVMQTLLAEVLLRKGDRTGALAVATKVTREPDHLFVAARVQLAAGGDRAALATAARLADDAAGESHAYAKLVRADAERLRGHADQAEILIREAVHLEDLPLAHIMLAQTFLDLKRYGDAKAELDSCWARRGELADAESDLPGLRYVPQILYFRALAEEGLSDHAASTKDLEAFVAWQPKGDGDALLTDARARLRH